MLLAKKKKSNFMYTFKLPFWQFFTKMALLNPCMKFENLDILLKLYENDNKKKHPYHVAGPTNSRIMQEKIQKVDFQKKSP